MAGGSETRTLQTLRLSSVFGKKTTKFRVSLSLR